MAQTGPIFRKEFTVHIGGPYEAGELGFAYKGKAYPLPLPPVPPGKVSSGGVTVGDRIVVTIERVTTGETVEEKSK